MGTQVKMYNYDLLNHHPSMTFKLLQVGVLAIWVN